MYKSKGFGVFMKLAVVNSIIIRHSLWAMDPMVNYDTYTYIIINVGFLFKNPSK